MRTFLTSSVLGVTMTASALFAQAPDVLICSGSLDGIFRLVDRDGDGKYLSDGEAYDYLLHGRNTSPRNVLIGRGPQGNTPRLYYSDTLLEQVRWMWDQNGDGVIDMLTEDHLAIDFTTLPNGSAAAHVSFIAHGPTSAAGNETWYVTNSSGTVEGLYQLEDLNNDGDFQDIINGVGEIRALYVEGVQTQNVIGNLKFTVPAPSAGQTGLQAVIYDPNWGPRGRVICEEENRDFTIAFEDLDGDGDFDDAGEAYLFSNLYFGATNSMRLEANPDSLAGLLPIAVEVRSHVIDTSGGTTIWYMQPATTSSTSTSAGSRAKIFRAEDKNMDGDVNDASEVTIFSDMSLTSAGALPGYNFGYGMVSYKGALYITCEFDSAPDQEQLVKLVDNNGDGDADDVGEQDVLWFLPVDRTHYQPTIIDNGFLPAPPAGLPGTYRYRGDAICQSSLNTTANPAPMFHNIAVGNSGTSNWDDKPVIGQATAMRTWGAAATSIGVTNVALSELATPLPLNPPTASCNVYLLPIIGMAFNTDAEGMGNNPLPIPNNVSLIGLELYFQSAVLDVPTPTNPIGVTTSDYVWLRVGAFSYSIH